MKYQNHISVILKFIMFWFDIPLIISLMRLNWKSRRIPLQYVAYTPPSSTVTESKWNVVPFSKLSKPDGVSPCICQRRSLIPRNLGGMPPIIFIPRSTSSPTFAVTVISRGSMRPDGKEYIIWQFRSLPHGCLKWLLTIFFNQTVVF